MVAGPKGRQWAQTPGPLTSRLPVSESQLGPRTFPPTPPAPAATPVVLRLVPLKQGSLAATEVGARVTVGVEGLLCRDGVTGSGCGTRTPPSWQEGVPRHCGPGRPSRTGECLRRWSRPRRPPRGTGRTGPNRDGEGDGVPSTRVSGVGSCRGGDGGGPFVGGVVSTEGLGKPS